MSIYEVYLENSQTMYFLIRWILNHDRFHISSENQLETLNENVLRQKFQ